MTPRRWRRRILAISSRGASMSLVPGDLRIRLPQVQGHDVERPVEFFAQEPWHGELDDRLRRRVSHERRGELHTWAQLGDLIVIQDGTVPDSKHLAGYGLELRQQVFGRGDGGLPLANDAAGHG